MNREAMTDADFIAAMSQGLPRVDGTEVLELGNADLVGSGTWTGWDGPRDFAPLPGEPAEDARVPRPVVPSALNDARVTLEWARSGRERPREGVR